jgi:hypothetical protein
VVPDAGPTFLSLGHEDVEGGLLGAAVARSHRSFAIVHLLDFLA